MPKQMFINVVNEEESRIAKLSDGLLEELSIETSLDEFIEGNIYKARVERVLASLDADVTPLDAGATFNRVASRTD